MYFGAFADETGDVEIVRSVQLLARMTIPEGTDIVIDGQVGNGIDVFIQASGDRFFDIEAGATVILRDLWLTGGQATGENGNWSSNEIN